MQIKAILIYPHRIRWKFPFSLASNKKVKATMLCTCRASYAVETCEFCDLMTSDWIIVRRIFHRFWIASKIVNEISVQIYITRNIMHMIRALRFSVLVSFFHFLQAYFTITMLRFGKIYISEWVMSCIHVLRSYYVVLSLRIYTLFFAPATIRGLYKPQVQFASVLCLWIMLHFSCNYLSTTWILVVKYIHHKKKWHK